MNLSKLRNGALVHMAGLELGSPDTFLHRIKNGILAFTPGVNIKRNHGYGVSYPQIVYSENNLPISIGKTMNDKYIVLVDSYISTSMLLREDGLGSKACLYDTLPITYTVDDVVGEIKRYSEQEDIWGDCEYIKTIPLKDLNSIVNDEDEYIKINIIASIRNMIDDIFFNTEFNDYKKRIEDEFICL